MQGCWSWIEWVLYTKLFMFLKCFIFSYVFIGIVILCSTVSWHNNVVLAKVFFSEVVIWISAALFFVIITTKKVLVFILVDRETRLTSLLFIPSFNFAMSGLYCMLVRKRCVSSKTSIKKELLQVLSIDCVIPLKTTASFFAKT